MRLRNVYVCEKHKDRSIEKCHHCEIVRLNSIIKKLKTKDRKRTNKVHDCKCGCGQKHSPLPPGTWMSYISGWHRIRTVDVDGPNYSSNEIGCGNDPNSAVEEGWDWFHRKMDRDREGQCWYCKDNPDWKEEYFNDPPPCPVCKKEAT